MLTEISLNILDIVQNSIRASANLIEITVEIDENRDLMHVYIKDNGNGMTNEQLEQVVDPFFTTRTTRKVGLGLSFLKLASEITGGTFAITSELSKRTEVHTTFTLSHIDRMPIGDITTTIHSLITSYYNIDFIYVYSFNNKSFTLDTRQIRMQLGDIPLNTPDVSIFIKEFLKDNKEEIDGGAVY